MRRTLISALAAHTALAAYYRYRPQPEGINGWNQTYRVPVEDISFHHDSTWYEDGQRRHIGQITDEIVSLIEGARTLTLMDFFLFNLHHVTEGDVPPSTRRVANAFAEKQHPAYFITDPLNISYGTTSCRPLEWLEENGVAVCITNLRKLRDNNLLYSPFWRAFLQWFGTGRSGVFPNPLQQGRTTSMRAVLEALNGKSNHRKVIVADEDDSYATMLTSANLNDADSYFLNVGVKIRSQPVARHFLEAEKAVARMSGCDVPAHIPPADDEGAARVTPLMGNQIRRALFGDLRRAGSGDQLYVLSLFLTHRGVIRELTRAARRGVDVTAVLDPNKNTFIRKEDGFPNPVAAAELQEAGIAVRWANAGDEEMHAKFFLLRQEDSIILNAGSANMSRRSLSNTNLEANVRVELPVDAPAAQKALEYVRWLTATPHSLDEERAWHSPSAHWLYRLEEATGITIY